jgi:predicted Zn-ribbon and HTH transcriptional regulator
MPTTNPDKELMMHCPACKADSLGWLWTPSKAAKSSLCPHCMTWTPWDELKQPD